MENKRHALITSLVLMLLLSALPAFAEIKEPECDIANEVLCLPKTDKSDIVIHVHYPYLAHCGLKIIPTDNFVFPGIEKLARSLEALSESGVTHPIVADGNILRIDLKKTAHAYIDQVTLRSKAGRTIQNELESAFGPVASQITIGIVPIKCPAK